MKVMFALIGLGLFLGIYAIGLAFTFRIMDKFMDKSLNKSLKELNK